MNVRDFDSAGTLKDYIIAQAIVQSKVQQIVTDAGRWYLFWWT